jgi:hypothetical protein
MPNTDRHALVKLFIEGVVAVLFSVLAWNAHRVTSELDRIVMELHGVKIVVEGIRFHTAALAQTVDRIDAIQRRNSEIITELRSQNQNRRRND